MKSIKRWYLWIAVILLLVAGTTISFYLFESGEKSDENSDWLPVNSAKAVPSDALLMACFKEASVASSILTDSSSVFLPLTGKQSPFNRVLETLSGFPGDIVISVHTSAKNEISPLICYKLPEDQQRADSLKVKILSQAGGEKHQNYNNLVINNAGGIFYTLTPEYFIASPSLMVLESSVRHLLSGSSVLDNQELKKVIKVLPGANNVLIINHTHIGKLISAIGSPTLRKQSAFITKMAGWTLLSGNFSGNISGFTGSTYNSKDQGNYLYSLKGIQGKNSSVAMMLPYTTILAVTLTPDDFSDLAENFRDYRDFYSRQDLKAWSKAKEWFLEMKPQELAAALVFCKNQLHWVSLLKCGNSKSYNPAVIPGEDFIQGAYARLFGNIFGNTREDESYFSEGWLITGSKTVIGEYRNGALTDLTLQEFTASTQVEKSFGSDNSPVSFYASLTALPDSTSALFRKNIRPVIYDRIKGRNFEALTGSLSASGNIQLNVISDMSKRPSPDKDDPNAQSEAAAVRVVIPGGPFELINPTTGEKEYLEQLPNYMLRLTDKDRKGIWAIPFETPLRGFVEQVDFFNNKQLQMLFASGNRLYLLDRKGKYVSPYPKKVDSLILLGPKCYSLSSDGNFAIMVLGTDNTLRLYDHLCKPYPEWSNIKSREPVRNFPELKKIGRNNYFILRTDSQTRIYTANGIEVAKLPAGEKIAPDSEIKILSDDEIVVKSDKKRYFSIDVESGKIKLRR